MTSWHILTGGTSGMGLHIAKEASQDPDARLIVGARAPERAIDLRAAVSEPQLTVLELDLASPKSVRRFVDATLEVLSQEAGITSVLCNAGLQLIGPKEMLSSRVEKTFQVNVLGHLHLIEAFKPRLKPGGTVVTVGSGTHNPRDWLARSFGFRGADFPDAARVAAGDLSRAGRDTQLGMDRYATSKLCAILQAAQMARETPPELARFYAFDPGLMPGTELARERSKIEQFGWRHILPALRPVLPGVSSAERSAKALVQHCLRDPRHPSGSYVEFTGRLAPQSPLARDPDIATAFLTYARDLIAI